MPLPCPGCAHHPAWWPRAPSPSVVFMSRARVHAPTLPPPSRPPVHCSLSRSGGGASVAVGRERAPNPSEADMSRAHAHTPTPPPSPPSRTGARRSLAPHLASLPTLLAGVCSCCAVRGAQRSTQATCEAASFAQPYSLPGLVDGQVVVSCSDRPLMWHV